jgi:hypothetical protein
MGYPIINFFAYDLDGKKQTFSWYPSEYLFKDGDKFCFAADKNER